MGIRDKTEFSYLGLILIVLTFVSICTSITTAIMIYEGHGTLLIKGLMIGTFIFTALGIIIIILTVKVRKDNNKLYRKLGIPD